jgi:hypothetical protein
MFMFPVSARWCDYLQYYARDAQIRYVNIYDAGRSAATAI